MKNVRGTDKTKSGSIDKVQKYLESVPVKAQCWWRNDLSRRLDSAPSQLKLAYPELLSALDAMGLISGALKEASRARIEAAVKAYLRKQFDTDNEVRFRQVELHRSLFSLFVDVPATIREGGPAHGRPVHIGPPKAEMLLMQIQQQTAHSVGLATSSELGLPFEARRQPEAGGAPLILHALMARFISRRDLE